MFKSARWRNDKNKIKSVFKLQFNATLISNVKGDSLVISLIPADVGKPTAKLEKSVIKDGCCNWEKPVYETVKLVRDSKTGKFQERLYKFVVSTGSAKGSFLGEASVDFSNYALSTKFSSESFSLNNEKSEAVLHVSIERMLDTVEQRELDETDAAKLSSEDHSLISQLSNGDTNSTEDMSLSKALPQIAELNVNSRGSSGSIATMSSLESLAGSAPDVSTDDSSNSPRETDDIGVEQLKANLAGLSRQNDMSELELQTLRKQIVKETKRGQDLLKELFTVKEERDAYKDECQKLNAFKKSEIDGADPFVLLEELKEEIKHEKELNANLRIQLEKTQESNAELLLAVRDLDEMLEKKNLSSGVEVRCKSDDEDQRALEEIVKDHSDDKEAYLLEQKIMDLHSEVELCRRDRDEMEMQMEQLALDYEILKQENHDIMYKLEQSQVQEQLKIQYECSNSYSTVNELENQIESLEDELKKQSDEFLDSRVMINDLQNRIMSLEEELKKKSEEFSCSLVTVKELETRVESYEDELKKKSDEFSESQVKVKELENQKRSYEDESKKHLEEFSDSLLTIKDLGNQIEKYEYELKNKSNEVLELENQIESYEDELKKQSSEVSDLYLIIKELENQIKTYKVELKKQSRDFSDSLLTIHELENHIESCEDELENKSKEVSDSLHAIKELEENVKNLEQELENQAQGFEAELGVLTGAKIEAEKKAIKAEESLRKSRRQNADTAERIQDEFKRLSVQMASTFVANENLALKAVNEARELQLEKIRLQESLNKAKEDLHFVKRQLDLKGEITVKETALEKNHPTEFSKNEMETLKARNKSMEVELKEMEERYSEISLKFAEVEGERQQLVMTLRNLKHSKKI